MKDNMQVKGLVDVHLPSSGFRPSDWLYSWIQSGSSVFQEVEEWKEPPSGW